MPVRYTFLSSHCTGIWFYVGKEMKSRVIQAMAIYNFRLFDQVKGQTIKVKAILSHDNKKPWLPWAVCTSTNVKHPQIKNWCEY